jgi:hypothetical protein
MTDLIDEKELLTLLGSIVASATDTVSLRFQGFHHTKYPNFDIQTPRVNIASVLASPTDMSQLTQDTLSMIFATTATAWTNPRSLPRVLFGTLSDKITQRKLINDYDKIILLAKDNICIFTRHITLTSNAFKFHLLKVGVDAPVGVNVTPIGEVEKTHLKEVIKQLVTVDEYDAEVDVELSGVDIINTVSIDQVVFAASKMASTRIDSKMSIPQAIKLLTDSDNFKQGALSGATFTNQTLAMGINVITLPLGVNSIKDSIPRVVHSATVTNERVEGLRELLQKRVPKIVLDKIEGQQENNEIDPHSAFMAIYGENAPQSIKDDYELLFSTTNSDSEGEKVMDIDSDAISGNENLSD